MGEQVIDAAALAAFRKCLGTETCDTPYECGFEHECGTRKGVVYLADVRRVKEPGHG